MASESLTRASAGFRTLCCDIAAAEIFAALAARRLDALLLRGPAIAQRLYGEGERTYGDSDVLVPEHALVEVAELLRSLGYTPYMALGRAQHWLRTRDHAEVDLHLSLWGVQSPPADLWAALAACRTTIDVRGTDVPVPDHAGTALVIALHASQHGATAVHPLTDLDRALDRFEPAVWAGAAACAEASGSLVAFRQGLTARPAGRAVLGALGLTPSMSSQSALRMRGVRLPDYLYEGLPARERLSIIRKRIAPARAEIAAFTDPRAAQSTRWLLVAHGRRLVRLPARILRLAAGWRRVSRESHPPSRAHD